MKEEEKERRQLETSEIVTILVDSVVMCCIRRSGINFCVVVRAINQDVTYK